ncbi:MAG: hypothetical protein IJX09_04715 [Clostridia bacterium]|nr:hypothetical protein [Clostridia bacterium]
MEFKEVIYECGGCGSQHDPVEVEKSPDRVVKCPWCRKRTRFEPKPVTPIANPAAAYDPFAMPTSSAPAAQAPAAPAHAAPAAPAMAAVIPGAKVANEVRQAARFFKEKQFDTAVQFAQQVLASVLDHATSLFILAYVRAFVNNPRNRDALEKFFKETLPTIEMAGDELETFKDCVMFVRPNLIRYHADIIAAVVKNDKKGGPEFVDTFSPAIIKSYTDIEWVSDEIFATFKEAGKHGSMPKTWYALYQCALENPDSPVKVGWDYEDTVKDFYDNYVLRLEDLFKDIQDETLRMKFYGGATKIKNVFISKMN